MKESDVIANGYFEGSLVNYITLSFHITDNCDVLCVCYVMVSLGTISQRV